MKCPRCETDLAISERQGIEIDRCPSCRGVWLDRDELDKIITRSAAAPAKPDADWDHSASSALHPSRKRHKSFLEELFE